MSYSRNDWDIAIAFYVNWLCVFFFISRYCECGYWACARSYVPVSLSEFLTFSFEPTVTWMLITSIFIVSFSFFYSVCMYESVLFSVALSQYTPLCVCAFVCTFFRFVWLKRALFDHWIVCFQVCWDFVPDFNWPFEIGAFFSMVEQKYGRYQIGYTFSHWSNLLHVHHVIHLRNIEK